MKQKKWILIFCLVTINCFAATYVDPLSALPKTRTLALGNAYVGSDGDIYSGYYNMAGLAKLRTYEALILNTSTFGDVQFTSLCAAAPLGMLYNTLPAGVIYFGYTGVGIPSVKDVDFVAGTPTVIGDIDYKNDVYALGYANSIDVLQYGAVVKRFSHSLEATAASDRGYAGEAVVIDAGAQYILDKDLKLGVVLTNLFGNEINYGSGVIDDLPRSLIVGIGYKTIAWSQAVNLVLDCEVQTNGLNKNLLHLGAEIPFNEYFTLRTGINQEPAANANYMAVVNQLTLGMGLSYSGITFDYTYAPNDNLGETQHLFGLTYAGELEPVVLEKPSITVLAN